MMHPPPPSPPHLPHSRKNLQGPCIGGENEGVFLPDLQLSFIPTQVPPPPFLINAVLGGESESGGGELGDNENEAAACERKARRALLEDLRGAAGARRTDGRGPPAVPSARSAVPLRPRAFNAASGRPPPHPHRRTF